MATFRKVHTSFWSDPYVQELTPEEKYFYLYIITNDKTTQCGIYEITKRQMAYDTGYNTETISRLIEKFVTRGKIMFSCDTNEIAVKNWNKYNYVDSPKVKPLVNEQLSKVKNKKLIQYLYSIDTISTKEEEREEEQVQEEEQAINIGFEIFWDLYDKKIGLLEKIKKKWERLTNEERELAINHIPKYKESQPEKKYRKNPEVYLNNKSFNDEIINNGTNNNRTGGARVGKGLTEAQLREFVER